MNWQVGVLMALVFAWVGVIGVVAVDLSATARRVMWSAVIVVFAAFLGGCTREKIVYRDNPAGATPIEAVPAPAPASLKFPQGIPDNDIVVIPGVPTLHDVVNEEIHAMFPNCPVFAERCDGQGWSAQSFFSVLNGRLRSRGLWAGQHRDGQTDEIVVGRTCTGEWENYHAWVYVGYPMWAKPRSEKCAGDHCAGSGNSYRGNTIIPASFCK